MKYYPAFLDLHNKKTVVVGGGSVAERKAMLLLKAGAEVKVISPSLTSNLTKLKEQGLIKHFCRNYKKGDLKNAFIVIAATSSPVINTKIAHESDNLVNVAAPPSEGNFIVPSIVKRGPLTLAISTEGSSPAVSKAVRKEIEMHYGKEFARYLRFVEKVRKQAIQQIKDKGKREKFLKSLASEESFYILRTEGYDAISQKVLFELT